MFSSVWQADRLFVRSLVTGSVTQEENLIITFSRSCLNAGLHQVWVFCKHKRNPLFKFPMELKWTIIFTFNKSSHHFSISCVVVWSIYQKTMKRVECGISKCLTNSLKPKDSPLTMMQDKENQISEPQTIKHLAFLFKMRPTGWIDYQNSCRLIFCQLTHQCINWSLRL